MEDNLDSTTQPGQSNEIARVIDEVQIARNVIKQFKDVIHQPDFQAYTGIQVTNDIEELFKKKSKTFSDWLYEKYQVQEKQIRVSYEDLRKAIYTEYLDKLKIPTCPKLKSKLKSRYPTLTPHTLDLDIKYHGFVWKQLGNTNKYTLIEKADQAAERMRYLYEMKQIRDDIKTIVYVEVRTVNIYVNISHVPEQIQVDIGVAVSPLIGFIDVFVKKSDDLSITIDSWLNNNLTRLPEDAVFVIESFSKILDELHVPDKHSKKSDMIEWLTMNNVPFFATSHRGELIALIEMFKGRHQPKIESFKLLMAKNYKLIFRPRQLSHMKYLKFLYGFLNCVADDGHLDKLKADYLTILNGVSLDEWCENENEIATFETTMLEEDTKLELLIDKLMESVQNKNLDLSDFQNCEENRVDGDYIDNILIK